VILPVVFRDLATDDVRAIHSWYDTQQEGLGARFVSSLDLAAGLISQHPLSCPVAYRGIRRVLLPGFPYALFYLSQPDTVVVLACLHQSRNPRTVRKRLRSGA
jgi:plasmid stabilization system protein ParE